MFVSPDGKDGNPGSKSQPLATLGAAIEKAKAGGKRVYACAKTFTKAGTVATDVTIYGGLRFQWEFVGACVGGTTRTEWTAGADEVPVHVAGGVGLTMVDVNVTAVDASTPGASSIGILAESAATVDLTRAEVKAGLGRPVCQGWGSLGRPRTERRDPPEWTLAMPHRPSRRIRR